ncbi:HlyD family type I secretion periplasmic adaptor subunit [Marinobacteraceae bacterium S3BR75-40.1]
MILLFLRKKLSFANDGHDHLAFLPAAIEVERKPPAPGGRIILWSIMVFAVIAVVWACVGHIDIVAVAEGKVVPNGRVKTIQPMALGKVAGIHVQEGSPVRKGDPLITLDGTLTQADLERLEEDYALKRLRLARLQAFGTYLRDHAQKSAADERVMPALKTPSDLRDHPRLAFERQYLTGMVQEFRAADAAIASEIQAKASEKEYALSQLKSIEQTLPITEERTEALRDLYRKNMASRQDYLELEQRRLEQTESLNAQKHLVQQLAAEIENLKSQRARMLAESTRTSLEQQDQLHSELAALKKELVKARELNQQQKIRSPIDGVVQELSVTTLGGVVQPAQQLMNIVPENDDLLVEAWVLNKDIGFVQEGQTVDLKVNAFNFTKYGSLKGEILQISNDAVSDEEKGLRYLAQVELESDTLPEGGGRYRAAPGMAVTAEIKTGSRTIMDFFLSRMKKISNESLSER